MARQRIGQYRIVEEIATGAQGVVYRAFDEVNNRLVAIKIPELGRGTPDAFIERFRREAEVMSSIDHPNVVTQSTSFPGPQSATAWVSATELQ